MLTIPGLCWLCRMPLSIPAWGVCSRCSKQLPRLPCCCPQCGLPAVMADVPCGRCLKKTPPWQQIVMVTDYVLPLNLLVHKFKFRQQTALAPALARLLLLRILEAWRTRQLIRPDVIVSVPLHKRRQWQRGYNHSALLARWLAGRLQCDYWPGAVTRVRHTKIQHQLNARLRKRNIRNAFCLRAAVSGLHVALVDDVVTTGNTVAEIAHLLQRSGAASVQVWCLCRTLSAQVDKGMILR